MTPNEFLSLVEDIKRDTCVSMEASLESLGFSSLDMMVIICEAERKTKKTIRVESLRDVTTIKDLYNKLFN